MPFVHLPERGVNQYYCINPTWHYSTSLCTYPQESPLDPKKPNLLLIHSGGSSSAAQQRQFHDPQLKAAFNLIAIDAAFHGWTTGAQRDGNYGIHECAENFLCALDKVFAPRRVWFSILAEGHVGAQCATWMAHKRPEQVEAIVLASPGRMNELPSKTSMLYDWLEAAKTNKNGHGDKTGLLPPECLTFLYDYFFAGVDRDRERQAIFASAVQQRYGAGHSEHDAFHLMRWLEDPPLPAADLAAIEVPVMILAGELDQVSPLSAAEEWRDALTGARGGAQVQLLKGAPHLLMYAAPDTANRLVYQFLSTALELRPNVKPAGSGFATD